MALTTLAFVLLYLFGLYSSVFGAIVWAFITYQMVYFANPTIRWWSASLPDISYSFITVILMFFCVGARQKLKYRAVATLLPIKWMLAILAVQAAVIPIAIVPDHHETIVTDFLKLCLVMVAALMILNNIENIRKSIWAFLIGCAYIGYEARAVGRNGFGRVEGIGPVDSPDANDTAALLAPAVAIIFAIVSTASLRVKIIGAILAVWIVNGLVLINSRGAFLAVLGGCGYVLVRLYFMRVRVPWQRLVLICIIFVGLSGALYLTDDTFWGRMETLKDVEDESASGSHRYRMWLSTIPLASDYPFGVGASGYQALSRIYVDPSLFGERQQQKAVHSSWFQALAEIGWIGLFLFLGLVYSTFKLTRKSYKQTTEDGDITNGVLIIAIEGALISYLIAGTFIDRFRAEVLYWLVMYSAALFNVLVVKKNNNTIA